MHSSCSQITVVIHTSLLKKLLKHLDQIGISQLYSSYGRSAVLNETRGISTLFKSSDIINEPVEVLIFYLPIEHEEIVMKSIIKTSRLDIPGRGSVYTRHVKSFHHKNQNIVCSLKFETLYKDESLKPITSYSHLSQILCTMSKGLVDEVARLLLHLGVVPTITNAAGTGLRDQLGLLRITIPKEKELLSIVVGHSEAAALMDRIIHWGKLDRPGRGFIWQVPIEKGLINFKTSQKSIGQAASTEQIIAAIDSLKGSFTWRQGGSNLTQEKKRDYFKGTELYIQVDQGDSGKISQDLIKMGISGATIQSLKTLIEKQDEDQIVVPQEVLRVVVDDHLLQRILKEFEHNDACEIKGLLHSHFFGIHVNRAFNYKAGS